MRVEIRNTQNSEFTESRHTVYGL